eukprot:TRINITY_DN7_c12_g1_i1.p2 TRINITY_DN7_c12_g1~~TRINITY_DN7_c12_g1_i1.p2  ORF type:complete len:140 (+),score=30.42 TRINITY_DN7_c12_g1_i1:56-421(+)
MATFQPSAHINPGAPPPVSASEGSAEMVSRGSALAACSRNAYKVFMGSVGYGWVAGVIPIMAYQHYYKVVVRFPTKAMLLSMSSLYVAWIRTEHAQSACTRKIMDDLVFDENAIIDSDDIM